MEAENIPRQRSCTAPTFVLYFTLLLSLSALCCPLHAQTKRLNDNSDWWSILQDDTLPQGAKVSKRRPPDSTFFVAGIELGASSEERQISKEFGKAVQIDRGDASTGRHQLCYVSPSKDVHLIFEWGEVESVAYLFDATKSWDGQDACVVSQSVSARLATKNGLSIGVSPEFIRQKLGAPSLTGPNHLYYLFEYREKPTPAGLRQLRKDNPHMSEEDFRKNFLYLDVTAIIDARFNAGKLTYVAISRSETY